MVAFNGDKIRELTQGETVVCARELFDQMGHPPEAWNMSVSQSLTRILKDLGFTVVHKTTRPGYGGFYEYAKPIPAPPPAHLPQFIDPMVIVMAMSIRERFGDGALAAEVLRQMLK
ncbi:MULTISPECIES: hypothetical protein [unclassified Ruegeria]|uniref:hypothetical protein n=1 Tax=unclassified Ruegeria TaxID=2625375 RepID=UPI0014876D62|nr:MULTISPECIES: hypothetical protein [unclassified Ruegeria]